MKGTTGGRKRRRGAGVSLLVSVAAIAVVMIALLCQSAIAGVGTKKCPSIAGGFVRYPPGLTDGFERLPQPDDNVAPKKCPNVVAASFEYWEYMPGTSVPPRKCPNGPHAEMVRYPPPLVTAAFVSYKPPPGLAGLITPCLQGKGTDGRAARHNPGVAA